VTDGIDDLPLRARIRGDVAWTFRLSRELVETVQWGSGASAIHLHDPMQRIVRDIQALSVHASLLFTTNAELHGRVLCGLPPGTPKV